MRVDGIPARDLRSRRHARSARPHRQCAVRTAGRPAAAAPPAHPVRVRQPLHRVPRRARRVRAARHDRLQGEPDSNGAERVAAARAALADHRQRHRRIAGRYRRLLAAAEADARGQPAAHAPGGNGRMPRARTGAPVREPAGRTARLAAAPAAPRMARHRRQPVRRRAGSRGVGRARSRTSTGHRWPASRSWARVHRASFTARSGARTGIRHGRSRSSCSRAR